MAQNIVDVSFNIPKFDEDRELLKTKMMETYSFLKTQSANLIPIGAGSWTEVTKAMNAQAAALEKTSKANLIAAKQIAQVEKNNILAAKAATESAKATLAQEKAEQARLTTQSKQLDLTKKQTAANEKLSASAPTDIPLIIKSNPDEIINATTAVNKLDIAEAEAAMTSAEFGNSVNKSTTAMKTSVVVSKEEESARLALAKANSEQNVVLQGYNLQKAAANKAAKEEAKATLGMLGPYELLNKEYIEAKINAQNLAAQYGINSVEAKAAAATALGLNTELQAIDKTVGLSQRNVGNYGSAFTKGLSSIWNGMRKIAYILPGVGIGTLALFAIEPLTNFYKWLTRDSDALVALKEKMQDLNDVYKEANQNAAKEITDLKLIYEGSQDVKLSTEERIRAAKKLQDTYPDTFKNFTTEQIMLGEATKGYNALAASITKTALASAARTKIEALAAQKLDIEFQKAKIKAATDREIANAQATTGSGLELTAGLGPGKASQGLTKTEAQNVIRNRRDLAFKPLDEKMGSIDSQIKFLTNFAGQQELEKSVIGDDKESKKKTAKSTMESTKEALDLEFELYKIAQQRKLKLLEEEVGDTKKSLMERVLLAEQYRDASIELSQKTADHEIAIDKVKIKTLQENQKKAKTKTEKDNIGIEIKNTAAEIVIAQTNANNARKDAEEKFNKEYLQIVKDTEEQRVKAFKDAEDSIKNIRNEQQSAIDAGEATELGALDQLLKEKLISQEEYNKRKAKLENDALILSLQSQLQEEKGLRDIEKLLGNSTVEYDDKIIELTGKLQSAQNKDPNSKDKNSVIEAKKKEADLIKEIVQSTQDFINGLIDSSYERQIEHIQKLIDINNQRKEAEVANINASTLSNQEKAAQQIILDKTVAANNEKLQRDQVKLKQKQAKFDRDVAVLAVVENAAVAYFKLIAENGAVGFLEGAALGVTAAAQIAMILAKPLPQYGEGIESHPGGGAIVGEKKVNGAYQKELVTFPGGNTYLTSGPTLFGDLPKGSRVTPLEKGVMKPITTDVVDELRYRIMVTKTAEMLQAKEINNTNEKILEAIQEGSRMTVQAMKKQKTPNVTFISTGGWQEYIQKNVIE